MLKARLLSAVFNKIILPPTLLGCTQGCPTFMTIVSTKPLQDGRLLTFDERVLNTVKRKSGYLQTVLYEVSLLDDKHLAN